MSVTSPLGLCRAGSGSAKVPRARCHRWLSASLVGLGVLLSVAGAYAQQPAVATGSAAAGLETAKALNHAFAAVARKVRPAVVNISSTRVEQGRRVAASPLFHNLFPDFGDMLVEPAREVRSLGSGVIIRPDGYIVTNCHVVQGAQQITVRLHDEAEYAATVVGQDAFTDLAVVRIEARSLTPAAFGDAGKLEVGEWVIAVGSPLGLAQTVTAGIVSATGRKNIGIQGFENFIQTDAAINPGNSGGALVNLDGELVGINTAIASEGGGYDGVCFATPTSTVWPVVEALIRDGRIRRPWIGVVPRNLEGREATRLGLTEAAGVQIQNMIRNGPAHLAKLSPGDVIVKWQDKPVKTRAELADLVQATPIGNQAELVIVRAGKYYRAPVTMAERPTGLGARGVL